MLKNTMPKGTDTKPEQQIPDKLAWEEYDKDLDVKYLYDMFFGKSIDNVQQYFGNTQSIERMDELLFAPRPVFQYYVHAFAKFVMSDMAAGDSDSANPFLSLLEVRETRDPGSVKDILGSLSEALDFVSSHQKYFDADVNLYGDFRDRVKRIREICDA